MVPKLKKLLIACSMGCAGFSFSETLRIQNENCPLRVFDRREKKWRKESEIKLEKGMVIKVLRKSQLDADRVLFSTPKSTVFYFEASKKCLEDPNAVIAKLPLVTQESQKESPLQVEESVAPRDSWTSFGVAAGWYQEPLDVVLLTGVIQPARIFAFYVSPSFEFDSIFWRDYGFHFNAQLDLGLGKVGNYSANDPNQISSSRTIFMSINAGLGFDYHFIRDPKTQRTWLGLGPDLSGAIRYERLGRIQGGEFQAKDFRLTYGLGLRFLSQISNRVSLSGKWVFYGGDLRHYRAQMALLFTF
jgi:hypothetical protein